MSKRPLLLTSTAYALVDALLCAALLSACSPQTEGQRPVDMDAGLGGGLAQDSGGQMPGSGGGGTGEGDARPPLDAGTEDGAASGGSASGGAATGGTGGGGTDPNWNLVWADEFEYEGAPDPARWTYEVQGPGWVNDELQAYTNRLENARVEDGVLVIEARRDNFEGNDYTSARIHSGGKGDILYGRVDVRAKLPTGRGTWPAIWMYPSWPLAYGNWPNSGEIDIMEHVGHDPGVVHASIHCDAYNWPDGSQKTAQTMVATATSEFHVYRVEWDEQQIQAFVDEVPFFTFDNEGTGTATWPFDQPFHLIMNIAIGGMWGGQMGVDNNIFPTRMEVDYVRVYEAAN